MLQYYNECHGVVYMIDSSDPETLAISAETFSEFYRSCDIQFIFDTSIERVIDHPDLQGAPLLILANKQDKMVLENE